MALLVTQCEKPLLSESFRRIERSMDLMIMPGVCAGGQRRLILVLFEELFRVERGHTAGAGGGHGLAVAMILDVAGDKDAGNVRQAAVAWNDVAVFVQIELAAKGGGVRVVPYSDKDAVQLN